MLGSLAKKMLFSKDVILFAWISREMNPSSSNSGIFTLMTLDVDSLDKTKAKG